MANAEQSHADRLNRGRTLHSTIAAFTPAFTPADSSLTAANFGLFLDSLETANTTVSTTSAEFGVKAGIRREKFNALQETALQIKDYVLSNKAWKRWHDMTSTAADKVRGQAVPRPKKSPPPVVVVPGQPAPPPPKAKQGAYTQQGFADIDLLFGKLLAVLGKITGYTATAGSGLTLTELQAQHTAYKTALDDANDVEPAYTEAVAARDALYNDKETGLNAKMKAIKKAVGSQYKRKSTQFGAANAIKL